MVEYAMLRDFSGLDRSCISMLSPSPGSMTIDWYVD